MNTKNIFSLLLLKGIILIGGVPGSAHAEDLCVPFQDGRIDESVMSTMLNAAEAGYLYRIQASTSQVGFCVDSKFQRVNGVFKDFQGGMALIPETAKTGQTVVVIKTDSLDTRDSLIGNLIRSQRFFDVANYPEILFVSTDFKWINATQAELRGNLTLHGVTKPVIFNVELSGDGDQSIDEAEDILVKATTRISRSDFGMDTLSTLVSDTVQLCMSVKAKRYREA